MAARSFFAELKRRNVLRAALLYVGAIWALAQGVASLGPPLGVPDWVTRAIVLVGALGFPFWLSFAWFYELTPEGLKRESDVAPSESIAVNTGRRLDFLIIAVLGIAVALLLADRFFLRHGANPAVAEKSIAVLPFANTSGDAGNEYFSDGMSEELINALGRLQDLTVIGRSSSFQFKGKGEDAKSIGAKLGVAYLLEGSVRKAEDKVRIAVELVKATNGASVWSETYDRDLKDIFALQSDIAMQVARKLQSTLLGNAGAAAGTHDLKPDAPPSGNVTAYNALLQGNFYFERRTEEDVRKAIDLYQQATQLDARYALAHAKLTYARIELDASFTPSAGAARAALQAEVRDALAAARAVDPESADLHLAQGYVLEVLDFDLPGAQAEYLRAAKLAPQNPLVAVRLALIQSYVGQFDAAAAGFRHMLTLDPLSARGHQYLGMALARLGRYAEAEAMLRHGIELQPQAAVQHAYLAGMQVLAGRPVEALATAQQEPDEFWRNWALAFAADANGDRAASDRALDWLIKNDADDGASQIAQVYGYRKQPDEAFKWLDHALESHDGGLQQMRISLFLAPYEKDPRYAAIARKVRVWDESGATVRQP